MAEKRMKYDRQFREGVRILHETGKPIAHRPGRAHQRTKYRVSQTITCAVLGVSVSWFCQEATV